MTCHWIRIRFVWQVAEQQSCFYFCHILTLSKIIKNLVKFWIQPSFYIKQWNNAVLSLLVLKVGKARSFSPSVMLLDHLVGQLYRKFFQAKSSCELILHSKWSRWKRAVTDNSYSASYSSMSDCCPPVVDPLTFISLLGTIHKWCHAKNWNFDLWIWIFVVFVVPGIPVPGRVFCNG